MHEMLILGLDGVLASLGKPPVERYAAPRKQRWKSRAAKPGHSAPLPRKRLCWINIDDYPAPRLPQLNQLISTSRSLCKKQILWLAASTTPSQARTFIG